MGAAVSLVGAAAAVGLWLLLGLAVYAVVAGAVLLFLPSAEELPSGLVADAAFAFTLPLVLGLAWVASTGWRPR